MSRCSAANRTSRQGGVSVAQSRLDMAKAWIPAARLQS
jgi:hypothetical protein